jgi:hypothetical protein
MAPSRIMFIRHAEKPGEPPCTSDKGVDANGTTDKESLAVRGWQRAGALAHFFSSNKKLRPDLIFASREGVGSKSFRPQETVTPLAKLLGFTKRDGLVFTHLKDQLEPLINDVMTRKGKVLVAWEHTLIPKLVGLLPDPPKVPQKWPGKRFDVVWVLDRKSSGWKFRQIPQLLLAGDSDKPIPFKSHKKE